MARASERLHLTPQTISGLLLCLLISIFYCSELVAEDTLGNSVNFMLGYKKMDEEHWPPFGEHYTLGVEVVLRKEKYPFPIVFEFLSGEAEFNYFGTEKSSTKEINIGLRHEFNNWDKKIPFLETGVSYIKGEVVLEGLDRNLDNNFSESAFGAWVSAGFTWILENNTEMGFKIKISRAKTDIPSGEKVDLGGVHFIFFTGVHF